MNDNHDIERTDEKDRPFSFPYKRISAMKGHLLLIAISLLPLFTIPGSFRMRLIFLV